MTDCCVSNDLAHDEECECQSKIRGLEKELGNFRVALNEANGHVQRLEAELAKERDLGESWADDAGRKIHEISALMIRAENAEARLAELKRLSQRIGDDHHEEHDRPCVAASESLAAFEASHEQKADP